MISKLKKIIAEEEAASLLEYVLVLSVAVVIVVVATPGLRQMLLNAVATVGTRVTSFINS